MENQSDSKASKPNSSDGFNPPINNNLSNLADAPTYIPGLDPYAAGSSNSSPPLMNYQRSTDPAAASASLPVYTAPMKNKDGVIVMDTIPEQNSSRGGEARKRLSPLPSEYDTGVSPNSTTPSSSAPADRISEIAIGKYKTAMCRHWDTYRTCIFGSNCKYAHSREELRPTGVSCQQTKMEETVIPVPEHQAPGKTYSPLCKVRICNHWKIKGSCPWDTGCMFAHGQEELRRVRLSDVMPPGSSVDALYKTSMCHNLEKYGTCFVGNDCQFAHSLLEQRPTRSLSDNKVCKQCEMDSSFHACIKDTVIFRPFKSKFGPISKPLP